MDKLCSDPRFCRGYLLDFCPEKEFQRERELLVAVVADQGVAELCKAPNGELDRAAVRRLIAQIVSDHGYTEEGARWAVYSWIDALGLKLDPTNPLGIKSIPIPLPEPPRPIPQPVPPRESPLYKVLRAIGRRSGLSAILLVAAAVVIFYVVWPSGTVDFSSFQQVPGPSVSTPPVECLAFSADGKNLAGGTQGGNEILWSVGSSTTISGATRFGGPGCTIAYSGDGKFLGLISGAKLVIEGAAAGDVKQTFYDVTSFAFSPDGKILAGGRQDGTVSLWDAASLNTDTSPSSSSDTHNGSITAMAFSPDGRMLATGAYDGTVFLWSVEDYQAKLPRRLDKKHDDKIIGLSFSPDGKSLASAAQGEVSITIWDSESGQSKSSLTVPTPVLKLAFLPDHRSTFFSWDSKTLAVLREKNIFELWGTNSSREERSFTGEVTAFTYSPNRRTLALAVGDGVQLWRPR